MKRVYASWASGPLISRHRDKRWQKLAFSSLERGRGIEPGRVSGEPVRGSILSLPGTWERVGVLLNERLVNSALPLCRTAGPSSHRPRALQRITPRCATGWELFQVLSYGNSSSFRKDGARKSQNLDQDSWVPQSRFVPSLAQWGPNRGQSLGSTINNKSSSSTNFLSVLCNHLTPLGKVDIFPNFTHGETEAQS